MSEPKSNGVQLPGIADRSGLDGETVTLTCDHFIEFTDDSSQSSNIWPWPEPPFDSVRSKE